MSKSNDQANPTILGGKPPQGHGGRRLNKVPLIIVGVAALAVIASLAYAFKKRQQASVAGSPTETFRGHREAATPPDFLSAAPRNGAVPALSSEAPVKAGDHASPAAAASILSGPPAPAAGQLDRATTEPSPLERYWEDEERRRLELERRAYTASTALSIGSGGAGRARQEPPPALEASAADQALRAALAAGRAQAAGASTPSNARSRWANATPSRVELLRSRREPAPSRFVLTAGTVIPAALITGVNPELPGKFIAHVSRNVYDSTTGNYVLIPQGSRLFGEYDNAVTGGQERVLAAVRRINFPDGSTLELGRMGVVDQSGYSGLQDQVEHHFWHNFQGALLLSLFSSGVQLSQPQPSAGSNQTYTNQQIVAGALGQQLGQLGIETARRNLQKPPSLPVRPGYRFNIMVTKDIVLEPWQPSGP